MDLGFVRGQTDNLPKVDSLMITEYFVNSMNFTAAEIHGAINTVIGSSNIWKLCGWINPTEKKSRCIVRCEITPERKVCNKAYSVELIIKEIEEKIISVQCLDYAAYLGGCKHAVAFLMWIHRKSEKPVPTSVQCYWKKSKGHHFDLELFHSMSKYLEVVCRKNQIQFSPMLWDLLEM